MELERDVHVIVIAHLNDPQSIEIDGKKSNKCRIRLNDQLKFVAPELFTFDENPSAEYVDGFRMKCCFIKSSHMMPFIKEQDRTIEIVEATRHQSHIDIYKHYPIESFELPILSIRFDYPSISLNDWWRLFKTLISSSTSTIVDHHTKNIELLCAPAFNLPLPKQMARQSACLIKFYEMFKTTLFAIHRRSSSSSCLTTISHIRPAIELSFRSDLLRSFDERIQHHPRLQTLLARNCLCLVATGSNASSFQYDFSLLEYEIISRFNASECQLMTLVKQFALKHLRCSLDNAFLRTSILWICEIHDIEQYHHIFEVWISFMRDVCRARFLSHYFLDKVNIYEEHIQLEQTIKLINHENIDLFVVELEENLLFPYVYPYNDRMKLLVNFLESQPILALKMKAIYTVNVKSQFIDADCSLEEMCSILCHLSFLEDHDRENIHNFWSQQWQPLFIDYKRDDIVVRQAHVDSRPNQLAQQMTASVFKLIQMDLIQMIDVVRLEMK
jgi:hypothetical protein